MNEQVMERSREHTASVIRDHGKQPASVKMVLTLVEALMEKWHESNEKNVWRNGRLDVLEQEIAELKARPTMKDAGTWSHGVTYLEGDIVSHSGSAWVCRATHYSTGDAPDHQHFRLFVKRGRDGKDGLTPRLLR